MVFWYPLEWDLFVEGVGGPKMVQPYCLCGEAEYCVSVFVCVTCMHLFVYIREVGWVGGCVVVWVSMCGSMGACVCMGGCVSVGGGGLYRINTNK